mmetsp:Transcript_15748/g.43033  ORF Transcript_15748/g.43033 Transcript_15748/m.43033 type:complete len:313 (+) Transcript_15748:360-1298(+)
MEPSSRMSKTSMWGQCAPPSATSEVVAKNVDELELEPAMAMALGLLLMDATLRCSVKSAPPKCHTLKSALDSSCSATANQFPLPERAMSPPRSVNMVSPASCERVRFIFQQITLLLHMRTAIVKGSDDVEHKIVGSSPARSASVSSIQIFNGSSSCSCPLGHTMIKFRIPSFCAWRDKTSRSTAMLDVLGFTTTPRTTDSTLACVKRCWLKTQFCRTLYKPTTDFVWKTTVSSPMPAKVALQMSWSSSTTATATVERSVTSWSNCRVSKVVLSPRLAMAITQSKGVVPEASGRRKSAFEESRSCHARGGTLK